MAGGKEMKETCGTCKEWKDMGRAPMGKCTLANAWCAFDRHPKENDGCYSPKEDRE